MGIVSSLIMDGDQIPSLRRWQQALLISQFDLYDDWFLKRYSGCITIRTHHWYHCLWNLYSTALLPILGCIRGNARCSDLIKLPDSIRFRTGGYKYADYGSSCRLSWCFPSGYLFWHSSSAMDFPTLYGQRMAPIMCGIAGVKIEKWWKFIVPIFLVLLLTQGILIGISTIVF